MIIIEDKKIIFSIVITTFNNKNTIEKTLDSVMEQSLDSDLYEIVIVDDCSNDGTWEILQRYNNFNIKKYRLARNSGGPSIPRNTGIEHSIGKYLYFLDGDDWLEQNILETISINKKWHKSDLIISKVIKHTEKNQSVHARFMTAKTYINEQSYKIPYLYYYLGPGGKFIKRELIEKHDIQFPINLHFGEDKLFFVKVYEKAQKVTTTTCIGVHINRYSDNISIVRRTHFIKKRESDLAIFDYVLDMKDKKRRDKLLLRNLEYDLLTSCNSHIFLDSSKETKVNVFEMIKTVFENVYVKKRIVPQIDAKFNDAVVAIYSNDFNKFEAYFEWLKRGHKLLEKLSDNHYEFKDTDDNDFRIITPFANLKNLQVMQKAMYLQIEVNNLKDSRIKEIQLESRTYYKQNITYEDMTLEDGFFTIKLNQELLESLATGIYNIVIIYDEYKTLNVKYGYTKKIKRTSTTATIYPTINGNLALKIQRNE